MLATRPQKNKNKINKKKKHLAQACIEPYGHNFHTVNLLSANGNLTHRKMNGASLL